MTKAALKVKALSAYKEFHDKLIVVTAEEWPSFCEWASDHGLHWYDMEIDKFNPFLSEIYSSSSCGITIRIDGPNGTVLWGLPDLVIRKETMIPFSDIVQFRPANIDPGDLEALLLKEDIYGV